MIFDLSKGEISKELAATQTRTCKRIYHMLENVPGVILGDDVGMGKTYVAMATAVMSLRDNPNEKIYIITPNWTMNEKWFKNFISFIQNNLIDSSIIEKKDICRIEQDQYSKGSFLDQYKQAKKKKIIISPINVFGSRCSVAEKTFYLLSWCQFKNKQDRTKQKILDLIGLQSQETDPDDVKNIGLSYSELPKYFFKQLDTLYKENKFEDIDALENKLIELKYKLLRSQIKDTSLLIIDEAHKLKNEYTVKRENLFTVFQQKFRKALFLTATPFQLNLEYELKSVFQMFSLAKLSNQERVLFDQQIDNLIESMSSYKYLISEFQECISSFSEIDRQDFLKLINNEKGNFSSSSSIGKDIYDNLLSCKAKTETEIKKYIVRNIKPKDDYRREIPGSMKRHNKTGIELTDDAYIKFALMEKVIYEILQSGDKTFITNLQQTFTSSYEALLSSLQNSTSNRKNTNQALQTLLKILSLPEEHIHPKLKEVSDYLSTINEKVLIFCSRIESIKKLCNFIEEAIENGKTKDINDVFVNKKIFKNYCKRFYSSQDIYWFLLQENYIYTILFPCLRLLSKEEKLPELNENKIITKYKKFNKTKKTNYLYVKRLTEQECFYQFVKDNPNWYSNLEQYPFLIESIRLILNDTYIINGFSCEDLEEEDDNYEGESRNIHEVINNIINYKGIWPVFSQQLNSIAPSDREILVNALIRFLRRDEKFFIDLKKENNGRIDKCVPDIFNKNWLSDFSNFIQAYIDPLKTEIDREEMISGLKANNFVDKIYGNTPEDAKEKIQAGFNSPFYPKILIVSPVMQEGVDLHKQCKKVIHYDLDWNPAAMEQRNGRIDRIGSLISQLIESGDKESKLEIFYPFIKNTIDEHIYNTVKDREKWFNLLLGGTPDWDSFDLDKNIVNIPAEIYKKLQIDLSC